MDSYKGAIAVIESISFNGTRAWILGNSYVEITVLVGKGADIVSFRDKESGVDALWQSRWGAHHLSSSRYHSDSATAWLAACAGGWNLMFPSSGPESRVLGGLQPDHGEASVIPWEVDAAIEDADHVELRVSTRLFGSPFRIDRVLTLKSRSRTLNVSDTFTNEGGVSFPYTATHHPTLGTPFIGAVCHLETNAVGVVVDDAYDPPHSPFPAGYRATWEATKNLLGRFPPRGQPQQLLAYLSYAPGPAWYRVTNPELELELDVSWQASEFPFAWIFQEFDGSADFPWFGNTYIAAIEPSTCMPARGLAHAEVHGEVDYLAPGQSVTKAVSASFGPSNSRVSEAAFIEAG